MGGASERRVLIVAGEASGDRHAARLVGALRDLGACRVRGITGPALAAAGAESVAPMDDLAVIGFTGVLARLPRIRRAWRRLLAEAGDFRPHAALLVDSPGFNFRVGPALRRRGIPVFYYIAPQVWAWHRSRAAGMARWVDRLAVVFPFEEPLFRDAGVTTRFVGHPLLEDLEPEVDRSRLRAELGLGPADGPLLGLLPGSRRGEFRVHAPIMVEAAGQLRPRLPGLVVALALAPGLEPGRAALAALERAGVRVVRGRTRALEAHADACAVASGTATLETALFGTPLVIVYRTGALNYAIARRVVTLTHIGLPNIVAGEEVAPELIQDALTPARLAQALGAMLCDPEALAQRRRRLARVRERLGEPGAARRAAEWLWAMMA
ncbi:MAG TPA: lipid-A-disaccharide synthase [Candidatus Eisenbacteria bacterium]